MTNSGARSLVVDGESFTGPGAGDYLVSASTCRGRVPGGGTCSVWVRFAPSKGEEKREAKLVLDTNATPATYEVDLLGIAGTLPVGCARDARKRRDERHQRCGGQPGAAGADGRPGAAVPPARWERPARPGPPGRRDQRVIREPA